METKQNVKEKSTSYLTFKLGDEEYGVHVYQVLNILEMTHITKVPKSPGYMKGIINLRGSVLPVIDTRLKLGLSETIVQKNTCIIVMDLKVEEQDLQVGAVVDEVLSVTEIGKTEIGEAPGIGNTYQSEFIFGTANVDESFIMLLDMNKIFSVNDLDFMKQSQSHQKTTQVE